MGVIPELLKRATHHFRTGQAAMASVSLQAYLTHPDRKAHKIDLELFRAVHAGDYLWAADILSVALAPMYA